VRILISFSAEEDVLYCIGFEPAGCVLPGGVKPSKHLLNFVGFVKQLKNH
jgi:hypothetical protein